MSADIKARFYALEDELFTFKETAHPDNYDLPLAEYMDTVTDAAVLAKYREMNALLDEHHELFFVS